MTSNFGCIETAILVKVKRDILDFNIYINLILKELKISSFSLGKFFGKVENGQKKCPKIEKVDSGLQKHVLAA